jgi:hypothetical protein
MKIFETENSNTSTGQAYIYSYSVNGVEYTLKATVSSSETDKVGDTGTIWYNPKKPKDAQTFRYESDKIYKIIFIIGIIMVLLGIGTETNMEAISDVKNRAADNNTLICRL